MPLKALISTFLILSIFSGHADATSGRRNPATDLSHFMTGFKKALEERDLPTVSDYLAKIKTQSLTEKDYLDLITKAAAPSSPPCFINALTAQMVSAFPQYRIQDYFYSTGAITEKGLRLILDQHLPKLAPHTHYSIHSTYSSLADKLRNAMKTEKSYGLFFHEGSNAHWSLIYLNKNLKKDNCIIQILDSVGHTQMITIARAIETAVPAGCSIAYSEDRRQYDTTTCSIFALTDFLELSERDELSLDSRPDRSARPDTFIKMNLAPKLMALAQSDVTKDGTLHEMAEATSIVIPKYPVDLTHQMHKHKELSCYQDMESYFNYRKDVKLNVGSKVLRDQYARKIIEQLISE